MKIKCCSPADLATEYPEQKETTEVLFQLTVSVITGTGKNLQTCTRIKQPLVREILKKSKDNTGSLQPNTGSLQQDTKEQHQLQIKHKKPHHQVKVFT